MDITPSFASVPGRPRFSPGGLVGIAAAVFVVCFALVVAIGATAGGALMVAVLVAGLGTAAVASQGAGRVILAVLLVLPLLLGVRLAQVEHDRQERIEQLQQRMRMQDLP